jgi:hypothetical protein
MSRIIRRRWKSKFARFILDFGTTALSEEIDVHTSAIYHWVHGTTTPRPAHAAILQRLAGERGVRLSMDEIYGHAPKIRAVEIKLDGGQTPNVSEILNHRGKFAAADPTTSRRANR